MDRRQQIIDAARRVFAKDGFRGATIESIAAEAGLKNPSLIYWYFKSKKELFQAMVEDLSPLLKNLPDFWQRIDDSPEEVLTLLGGTLLGALDNDEKKQVLRILLSESTRIPDTANTLAEKLILALNFIIAYIEHQVDTGSLKKHDTRCSGRMLLGSFVFYILGRELFMPFRAGLPSQEDYVREVVDIFLNGVRQDKTGN